MSKKPSQHVVKNPSDVWKCFKTVALRMAFDFYNKVNYAFNTPSLET